MNVARPYSAFQLARRPWIRTQNGKTKKTKKLLWTNSKYYLPDSGLIGIPQLNLHPSWRYRIVFPFQPSLLLRILFPYVSGTIRTKVVFTHCTLQPSRCCVRVEGHNCLKCKHWLCHRAPGWPWQSLLTSLTPYSPSIKWKWLTLYTQVCTDSLDPGLARSRQELPITTLGHTLKMPLGERKGQLCLILNEKLLKILKTTE